MSENIETVKKRIQSKKEKLAGKILEWSKKNSPEYPWRKTTSSYNIMISEMLLRRTRASNVIPVYEKFLKKFPDVVTLARSSNHNIENVIKSLGIKSRSRKIKSVAKTIVKEYFGIIPNDEDKLLMTIGKESHYAVNAVLCFGMNRKVPIFDVNVKRIFERVFSINFGKAPHKKKQTWNLVAEALPDKDVKQYNWTLLDLGKEICTSSNPKCPICPIKSICDYAKNSF